MNTFQLQSIAVLRFNTVHQCQLTDPSNYNRFSITLSFSIPSTQRKSIFIDIEMNAPLSPFGRGALAVGSALAALSNPANAEMVAVLGEVTGTSAVRRLRRRIERSPVGREMLETQTPVRFPANGEEGLAEMRSMPDGSLGRAYAKFMDERGFSPEERMEVRFVEDPRDKWVVQRYRDVHDMWHTVTGMPTNLLGEIALKWFEAAHTGLPVALLSAVAAPVRLESKQKRLLATELVPWALKSAASANDLMAIRYEDHLERDVEELRKEWNVQTVTVSRPEILYGKKWVREQRERREREERERMEQNVAKE